MNGNIKDNTCIYNFCTIFCFLYKVTLISHVYLSSHAWKNGPVLKSVGFSYNLIYIFTIRFTRAT